MSADAPAPAPAFEWPPPPVELVAQLVDEPVIDGPAAPVATPVAAPAVTPPDELAPAASPIETPIAAQLEVQSEFLRLLGVVTSMCDHVIEYIEADRAERRVMIETLAQLSRVITDGAAAAVAAAAPAPEIVSRERVIGGSMPAGPPCEQSLGSERIIDLRERERDPEPDFETEPEIQLGIAPETHIGIDTATDTASETATHPSGPRTEIEIAVEVRGRFGDRWVDGFEICEVMTTPDGPRYRLRRHRDGVVLPELFDATSIRHVETFEQLNGDQLNGARGYWSRS